MAYTKRSQVEARRLVELLRWMVAERLRQVAADEERVRAGEIAAHQPIL